MFVGAYILHSFGLSMDLSNALGCETALTGLLVTYSMRTGSAGMSEHKAMICLSCAFSSFCWMTIIANRGSSVLAFSFATTVFLPAISALMKTGFAWFVGGRTLREDEMHAVSMFYRYHFLVVVVAFIAMLWAADTEKAKKMEDKIENLSSQVSNLCSQVSDQFSNLKSEFSNLKSEFSNLGSQVKNISEIVQTLKVAMMVRGILVNSPAARPGKHICLS
jgi:hypothetical protein